MDRVVFQCPACNEEIGVEPTDSDIPVRCPKCGNRIRIPQEKLATLDRRRRPYILYAVMLVALCWLTTITLGTATIRPEVNRSLANLEKNFRRTSVRIKSPAPFVISYRIEATEALVGIDAGYTLTKYYVWFFRLKWEIPTSSVPRILKWVWP